MAVRMEQHPVFEGITAPVDTPVDVVIVPTRFFGDAFAADGTEAALQAPLLTQARSVFQVGQDSVVLTLFEVHLPDGIVGVGRVSHLDMASYRDRSHGKESDHDFGPALVDHMGVEDVPSALLLSEVLLVDPAGRLLSVFALRPSPQCPVNVAVDIYEDLFADDISVVVGPSSDHRIEFHDQAVGG